jgi:murein DD-endopeptidase MepM/ murein hydrolase activator NlpD
MQSGGSERRQDREERRMTFIVVPHGGNDLGTRSFEVSYRRLRVVGVLALLVVVTTLVMAASWWYVAAQAARVPGPAREVDRLEAEREQVQELAGTLMRLERQYEQVRQMLGADQQGTGSIWLPPAGSEREETLADTVRASVPNSWPLTQRGFITREHLGRLPGEHPGLDIAVAEGSYVRAAGAGIVIQSAEDPVYGKYVRVRHADGYETMYAHASLLFVAVDDRVERNEVIALSGNTGTSTAPHLHFEIRKDGEPIDPRTMMQPPS